MDENIKQEIAMNTLEISPHIFNLSKTKENVHIGLLELISMYGKFMIANGTKNPVFLLTKDSIGILKTPNIRCSGRFTSAPDLSKDLRNIPGIIGEYDGVLLIEVYNINGRFSEQKVDEVVFTTINFKESHK